jgi:CelD/BcsL family acetyltransferase involved in cellulose biosynthesis
VSARVVPLAELGERDLAAWRRLSDRAAEPNPFFDPDFVLPAARALGEWDEVALLLLADGEEWAACLPVRRYRRWHRLPLPCLATWLHSYCLLGTPLLAPGREEEALAAIVTAATAVAGAFAGFEWISATGPIAEGLAAAAPPRATEFDRFSRATLERRPENDYLEGWVKSKDRRELRRRARLLGEELGGEPELVDRSEDDAAIETFLRLEASGWKGREGTALATIPGHPEFLRETARGFGERGAFRLFMLEAGGEAVAGRCSYVAAGVDFCFKIGYDERFSRFGPGRELELQMVDRFHADASLRMLDSCTAPDNDLYNRLWRDRRELASTAIPAPGARGRLAAPALRGAIALRERRRQRAVD